MVALTGAATVRLSMVMIAAGHAGRRLALPPDQSAAGRTAAAPSGPREPDR